MPNAWQIHSRFKFTLKDEFEFNYSVIIDILYLEGKPVLHVVDSATSFNAARFLKDMSAKSAWDTLRECWIDTYQGPPKYVVHNAGKNFSLNEFRQQAKSLVITVKEVPVEVHNSVGLVERYHAPLHRAYQIICDEFQHEKTTKEALLQMAVKAVCDSAGPNGIIPTLLVFGAYPRMTEDDPPSESVAMRAKTIQMAMKEIQRLRAERQIKGALTMRNDHDTYSTLNLPINFDVRMWRENKGWTGPFKLVSTDNKTCVIDMTHGPTKFRITAVKPYFTIMQVNEVENLKKSDYPERDVDNIETELNHGEKDDQPNFKKYKEKLPKVNEAGCQPKRTIKIPKRFLDHHEINSNNIQYLDDQFIASFEAKITPTMTFLSNKEKYDRELSVRLRQEGVIVEYSLKLIYKN